MLVGGNKCSLDMADSKGSSIRSVVHAGKHASLPPKIPFAGVSSACVDYIPGPTIGSRVVRKPKENFAHHQRTSSESLLIEEQPSWLDDLLNEPDAPIPKAGHRRSTSDSFAYGDAASFYTVPDDFAKKGLVSLPAWGSQDFNQCLDGWQGSLLPDINSFKQKNRPWETPLSRIPHSRDNNIAIQTSGLPGITRGADRAPSVPSEKHYQMESTQNDPKISSDRREISPAKQPSETDSKRAKQQFAQRSRVRKLQYIAELEKNVQALQAEGSEVSAELEFLNQQNLILSMENKTLSKRLESLTQEQMIKYLEHEVLERELGRLRALYQQQQNPTLQQPQEKQASAGHRRSSSRDLDSQFGNLSLKPKEPSSGQDNVTRSLHI